MKSKQTTKVQPFHFAGDTMHQIYLQKQQRLQKQQEEEELRNRWHPEPIPDYITEAKYNECDVTISEESGEVVKLDNDKILMEQTAIRIRERNLIQQQKQYKQYKLQQIRTQIQQQQQKQDNQQLQELRRRMYVKANPVKIQYNQKDFPKIQPRPVTRAKTPDFVKRMENRINNKNKIQ